METTERRDTRGRSLYVWLPGAQWEALRLLAEVEHRAAREQAVLLIVDGLARAGLLDVVCPEPAERTR